MKIKFNPILFTYLTITINIKNDTHNKQESQKLQILYSNACYNKKILIEIMYTQVLRQIGKRTYFIHVLTK